MVLNVGVLGVNGVLNVRGYMQGRVKLLKKWREFSGGGNGDGFFLQKGKHPPIEQSRAERSGRKQTKQKQKKEGMKTE